MTNLSSTFSFDLSIQDYVDHNSALIAGVDEVGRGCLFGEVVAAVVVLPLSQFHKLVEIGVQDSKKLTAKQRESLVPQIKGLATAWQVSSVNSQKIDEINILHASLLAMKKAISGLSVSPDLCLIDGNMLIPKLEYPQIAIVKGDRKSSVIAAASILAKVWRDQQMIDSHQAYPEYDLHNNKGYPTKKHLAAIAKYGLTPHHRRSFAPCRRFLMNNEA